MFLNSLDFVKIAAEDALKLIAKTNNQSYELTLKALALGDENVVNKLQELVFLAAEQCAKDANQGKLWK
jgi:hypothetical protein